MESLPLVEALDRAGYRLTQPRRAVASLIGGRDAHFTAAELLAEANARRLGIGRATIFRALDLFAELGLLERIDLPTGDHAYVPCGARHHHHVVCAVCGASTGVDDSGIQEVLDGIERRTGYVVDSHRLELYGRCPVHATATDTVAP